jgi:hypothetical protein
MNVFWILTAFITLLVVATLALRQQKMHCLNGNCSIVISSDKMDELTGKQQDDHIGEHAVDCIHSFKYFNQNNIECRKYDENDHGYSHTMVCVNPSDHRLKEIKQFSTANNIDLGYILVDGIFDNDAVPKCYSKDSMRNAMLRAAQQSVMQFNS